MKIKLLAVTLLMSAPQVFASSAPGYVCDYIGDGRTAPLRIQIEDQEGSYVAQLFQSCPSHRYSDHLRTDVSLVGEQFTFANSSFVMSEGQIQFYSPVEFCSGQQVYNEFDSLQLNCKSNYSESESEKNILAKLRLNERRINLMSEDGIGVVIRYRYETANSNKPHTWANDIEVVLSGEALDEFSDVQGWFYVDSKVSWDENWSHSTYPLAFNCQDGACVAKMPTTIPTLAYAMELAHWLKIRVDQNDLVDPVRNEGTFRVLFSPYGL